MKYKSYAVKAATPLGYSIFLQNQGQGFSFQQHLVHKLEGFIQASRAGRPEGWTPASADLSNPVIEQRLRDLGYML